MWMVHEILHAVYASKEGRLYWSIYVDTGTYGKVFNSIEILNSDVHESTNAVIAGSSMWVFNLFQIFYNNRCSHEEYIFKLCVHSERWILKLYLISCLCSPIFLNNIFDDIICLVNTDSILTLDYVNIEDL